MPCWTGPVASLRGSHNDEKRPSEEAWGEEVERDGCCAGGRASDLLQRPGLGLEVGFHTWAHWGNK